MLTALQGLVEDSSVPLASRLHDFLYNSGDGRIKMYLLWKILTFRRENADIFLHGSYLPLYADEVGRKHLCAFARIHENRGVIVATPRLMVGLMGQDSSRMPLGREVWGETLLHLPSQLTGHRLTDILSGEEIGAKTTPEGRLLVGEIFHHFPVALLACDQETATRQ
jgi:(1->4)-alpha-D-glucan 1-alpha-D-glucosylmutase